MHDLPYKHDIVLYLEVDSIFIAIYTYYISLYVRIIYTEGIDLNQTCLRPSSEISMLAVMGVALKAYQFNHTLSREVLLQRKRILSFTICKTRRRMKLNKCKFEI